MYGSTPEESQKGVKLLYLLVRDDRGVGPDQSQLVANFLKFEPAERHGIDRSF